MKLESFEIKYKGRKAIVTTEFDNLVELFRLEWQDDGSLDFIYKDIEGWESYTALQRKDLQALGSLIEGKTK